MLRTLLRFFLKLNEKFLLLEIYTRNFQDGFLLNLLILSSIKNPKIIEFGAHGHNQGMIGLAAHIFLKGKYILIDGFQNNLNEINNLKKKYDFKNIYTKKFIFNPKKNPEKFDKFIKEKLPHFQNADLLILDIDGHESKVIRELNFFRPKIIFFEENSKFESSYLLKLLKRKKRYFYIGKFDNNYIFSKKKIIGKKIKISKNKLNKFIYIFNKLNSKFLLGLYLRLFNKNKEIKELIKKPNPFSNKFNF